jgi:hypothetical protein
VRFLGAAIIIVIGGLLVSRVIKIEFLGRRRAIIP